MQEADEADKNLADTWNQHNSAYKEKAEVLKEERQNITEELHKLNQQKLEAAQKYGDKNATDDDLVDINVGGKIISARRGTLTQLKGTFLEALFSGRWEKKLQHDDLGRIFLDMNPVCFQSIVDFLIVKQLSPQDSSLVEPHTDKEHQHILAHMLKYFGLNKVISHPSHGLTSNIVTDQSHIETLYEWLSEDGFGGETQLLYRASRDGWEPSKFHDLCDNQGPTVTVIESSEGYIFGGFADTPWSSSVEGFRPSPKAFLFGLKCYSDIGPSKMKLKSPNIVKAVDHQCDYGPSFGSNCYILRNDPDDDPKEGCWELCNKYQCPAGQYIDSFFTQDENCFTAKEVEVFHVTKSKDRNPDAGEPKIERQHKRKRTNSSAKPSQPAWETMTFDEFPETIKGAMISKQKALKKAIRNVSAAQYNFEEEKKWIDSLSKYSEKDIVNLDVSGTRMSTNRSTLRFYKDSVLARQFDDTVWSQQGSQNNEEIKSWSHEQVVEWAKNHREIPDEVVCMLERNRVNGSELLACDREDLKDTGAPMTGLLALMLKAMMVRQMKSYGNATHIEQSPYCFGKIIDYLRLKSMSQIDDKDTSYLICINIQYPDMFQKVVDYYFPGELAAEVGLVPKKDSVTAAHDEKYLFY
uniref:TLDc domain-containing protein n=1 Tax=Helicotheca tamesis TaxID=374047 RepID=A0A7S2MT83_9STRA|mmetsp:Transcript_3066/g.4152  ORF Transcript_3066/g.4152 Transcript_3066/m.4152 type:complete len:637 (+) Transcript_3066:38-1948(+)|eukprot:CAMPEP_0185728016 /NCGR_PEP_ID=MMETSP1171-20130828/3520_1 /TAXON_ID=374046 /ORGANISM="Helicotheca tamensis, Strain CCMP826" /LENGTH=636 /DNA_ID=CAMNT_0028396673 /DNA_START=2044 /DNA_END=3954 /DNA_ORIENTATION=+